jgi:hypothetical protein
MLPFYNTLLQYSAKKSLEVFSFWVGKIDGMVQRMPHPSQHLDVLPRINSSREDNLLEVVSGDMVGATKSE